MLHLLFRAICEYTNPPLILGVFRSKELAEAARLEYLATVMHGGADPWAEQVYSEVSDSDLHIRCEIPLVACEGLGDGASNIADSSAENSAENSADKLVYVISAYFHGCGQVIRQFESIVGTREAAEARAAEVTRANADDDFWAGCRIDTVPLDRLTTNPDGYRGP
ncbi:MAG: hypothetical protein ACOYMM_05465 [Phycisphaerales bacterium]